METLSETETKEFHCRECGQFFIGQVLTFEGRELVPIRACPECVEKHQCEQRQQGDYEDRLALDAAWKTVCPPLYRDTEQSRLPQNLIRAAMDWSGERSLGFVGAAGTGKTRAAFLALRIQHFRGQIVEYINGSQFNRMIADRASDFPEMRDLANNKLQAVRSADILFLDDLGKQKFTEASEQELYDLLEYRTAHLKPVLWTANSNATELGKRLSSDRADAILRRLTEFSTIVKV